MVFTHGTSGHLDSVKETELFIEIEFSSPRNVFVHQRGRHFFVLVQQYGRHDVRRRRLKVGFTRAKARQKLKCLKTVLFNCHLF